MERERAKATAVGLSEGLLLGLLFVFACEGSKVGSCLGSGLSGGFGNGAEEASRVVEDTSVHGLAELFPGNGATRHKLMHELKYETLLLFCRKSYKLAIKTLMGS